MHGLGEGKRIHALKNTVNTILQIIALVVEDALKKRSSSEVLVASSNALGDLVMFFGSDFCNHVAQAPWLQALFQSSNNPEVVEALRKLREMMQQNGA